MPIDWDKLRVFHAVAEAGSFTHAGETLNLSQSAVSRQIQALEEALQVPLFHRHARGLILTEPGETLNRTVREVFAKLAMTEALLTESRERPAGRLKITSTTGFGSTWLAPRLNRFMALYPDVSVTLLLDDSDLDLAMREADVAVRMHPPRQPDLIQRHLASFGWRVCGSPDYLKQAGIPERAEDLDAHRLIIWGDHRAPIDEVNWLAEAGRAPRRPAPGRGGGEQPDRHPEGGTQRLGACRPARLHGRRAGWVAAGAARTQAAEAGRLFRLSGGNAPFQAGGGVPGLPGGRTHGKRQLDAPICMLCMRGQTIDQTCMRATRLSCLRPAQYRRSGFTAALPGNPSSPRREASLLTLPANPMGWRAFFFVHRQVSRAFIPAA